MRRPWGALLSLVAARLAVADDGFVCTGSPQLAAYSGYYALASLVRVAPTLRSWPAILKAVGADKAGVAIRDGEVLFSRAWHEGDTGGHCVRRDAQGLWVRDAAVPHRVSGPYQHVATLAENESLAYLSLFLHGCYISDRAERWCFARQEISVNGKPFSGSFGLDVMEFPEYGTSLRVPDQRLPLWVFVPTHDGWRVYADDFVSSDARVPVVPGRTRPSFTLRPIAEK